MRYWADVSTWHKQEHKVCPLTYKDQGVFPLVSSFWCWYQICTKHLHSCRSPNNGHWRHLPCERIYTWAHTSTSCSISFRVRVRPSTLTHPASVSSCWFTREVVVSATSPTAAGRKPGIPTAFWRRSTAGGSSFSAGSSFSTARLSAPCCSETVPCIFTWSGPGRSRSRRKVSPRSFRPVSGSYCSPSCWCRNKGIKGPLECMCASSSSPSYCPPESRFTLSNGTPPQGLDTDSRGPGWLLSPGSQIVPTPGSSSPLLGLCTTLSCRRKDALCYLFILSCCCWS